MCTATRLLCLTCYAVVASIRECCRRLTGSARGDLSFAHQSSNANHRNTRHGIGKDVISLLGRSLGVAVCSIPTTPNYLHPKQLNSRTQPPALVSLLSCPVGSLTSVYIIVIASSTPFSLHSPPQGRSGSMTFSRMADHRGPPQTQSPGPAKPRLACGGRPPMLPHFYVFSLSFSTTPIGHACHRLDGSTSQCFFCHAEKAIR